ncbi:hypothetical protein FA13DRAFT_1812408 [Coprinellus micaceus]|uniref:NACHT domain-containing protein n=1 Tax=Coprinellus micaceus TaxID=71717 RepID=A0A4Y7TJY0_COPMI|nr:hypothetical protein FA13DRAFT_1812408 [Coprinellus micaceus]
MKLKDQLEALILNPLRQLRCQFPEADLPKVFIIDGVDEVKVEDSGGTSRKLTLRRRDEDDHLEIISSLFHASKDPAFPFRIIVISRPERVFTEFFASQTQPKHRVKRFFLNKKYAPDSDIRLYLTSKFAEIRRRYNLSPSWPGQDIIEDLVRTASGQFIYAATVIRFVLDGTKPPPAQLQHLLESRTQNGDGGPLDSLDTLYTHILLSSPSPRLAARWIISLNSLSPCPSWASRLLLETEEGEGEHILRPLASLMSIPTSPGDRQSPYRVYHKSLIDFLKDDQRCPGSVRANEGDDNHPEQFLAKSWVALLRSKAPRIGIAPSEQKAFIEILAQPSNAESVSAACSKEVASLGEEELVACDVYWWMSQSFKELFLISRSPTAGGVYSLRNNAWWAFKSIHEKCPTSPGQCRESCKKWREDIKKACTDHGWRVPSRDLELLRDLSQTDPSYGAQECIAWDWRCRNGFSPRQSKFKVKAV